MHSRGLMSFSINQGDFATTYGTKRAMAIVLKRLP
jgi:hypothetical protein